MNREEAKYILNNYPCVCKYGSSPTNCSAALDRCELFDDEGLIEDWDIERSEEE